MIMEDIFEKGYDGRININVDMLIVSIWNKYVDDIDEKIYINNKAFFDANFRSPYDAVWAVEMGNWKYSDTFVFFNDDGYITSFRHWNDENSPIKIDRIDISNLIKDLEDMNKEKTGGDENNSISRAIHDALQEV